MPMTCKAGSRAPTQSESDTLVLLHATGGPSHPGEQGGAQALTTLPGPGTQPAAGLPATVSWTLLCAGLTRSALHGLRSLTPPQHRMSEVLLPPPSSVLSLNPLRHREVEKLAPGLTVCKWWSCAQSLSQTPQIKTGGA